MMPADSEDSITHLQSDLLQSEENERIAEITIIGLFFYISRME